MSRVLLAALLLALTATAAAPAAQGFAACASTAGVQVCASAEAYPDERQACVSAGADAAGTSFGGGTCAHA